MLGTSGYGVRVMTLTEFKQHPDRMIGYDADKKKHCIPMLYNKGKNPIRVIISGE